MVRSRPARWAGRCWHSGKLPKQGHFKVHISTAARGALAIQLMWLWRSGDGRKRNNNNNEKINPLYPDTSLTYELPQPGCSGISGRSWHRRIGSRWTRSLASRSRANRYLAVAIALHRRALSSAPRSKRSQRGLLSAFVRLSSTRSPWVKWAWKPAWSRPPVPAEHWTMLFGCDLPFHTTKSSPPLACRIFNVW